MKFNKSNYENLSLNELSELIADLKEYYNERYFNKLKRIRICNWLGSNIVREIKHDYPDLIINWEGNRGSVGIIYIDIPVELYNDKLVNEIKIKYDDVNPNE